MEDEYSIKIIPMECIPYHQWSDVDKTTYRSIGFLTAVSDRKAMGEREIQ